MRKFSNKGSKDLDTQNLTKKLAHLEDILGQHSAIISKKKFSHDPPPPLDIMM